MADVSTPEPSRPASTPDEIFALILRVSADDSLPLAVRREVCAALYQGSYAMQERAAGRAVSRGRTDPPTDEEIAAQRRRSGAWVIAWDMPRILTRPSELRRLAARCRLRNTPMRWIPIDRGGVAEAWPKVPPEKDKPCSV